MKYNGATLARMNIKRCITLKAKGEGVVGFIYPRQTSAHFPISPTLAVEKSSCLGFWSYNWCLLGFSNHLGDNEVGDVYGVQHQHGMETQYWKGVAGTPYYGLRNLLD